MVADLSVEDSYKLTSSSVEWRHEMYFFNREANFIETVTRYAHFDSFIYSNQDAMVEKQICIGLLFLSN